MQAIKHILQAVIGPYAGEAFVIGSRATVGRAADCDIQVLDAAVSRHHARLSVVQAETVLTDLASDNGTFVNGQRVSKTVLKAGDAVLLADALFRYETVPDVDAESSSVFNNKITTSATLCRTASTVDAPTDRLVPRAANGGGAGYAKRTLTRPLAGPLTVTPAHRAQPADDHRLEEASDTAVLETLGAWDRTAPTRLSSPKHPPGSFELAAVVRYRQLRAQHLRGEALDLEQRRLHDRLAGYLRRPAVVPSGDAHLRQSARFDCRLPITLTYKHDRGITVVDGTAHNIGAGGAKLEVGPVALVVGEVVWVRLQLVADNDDSSVVFESRVVWSDDRELGIMFFGAPTIDTDAAHT